MLSTPDLKRLRSIEDFAIDIVSYAHNSYSPTILNYYKKGKDFSFLKGSLNTIEELLTSYGTPVVSTVQKTYPKVVTTVDTKIDGVFNGVQNVWETRVKSSYPAKAVTSCATAIQTQREEFPEKLAYLKSLTTKEARENYLKFIESKVHELQTMSKEVPQLAYDAIKSAIQNAREKIDSGYLEALKKVDELWQATVNHSKVKTAKKQAEDLSQKVQENEFVKKANDVVQTVTKQGNEFVQTVQSKVKGIPTPKQSRHEEMD